MKHLYRLISVLLIAGISLIVLAKVNISGDERLPILEEGFVQGVNAPVTPEQVEWWNKDYKYYRQLTLHNNDVERLLAEDTWVELQINHSELVNSGKSLINAEDITVVYLNDESYQELEVHVSQPNTTISEIYFKTVESIAPISSVNNYYLYYGNKAATAKNDNINVIPAKHNYSFSIGEEQRAVIITNLSRKWYLKDYNALPTEDKVVNYKIHLATTELISDERLKVTLTDTTGRVVTYVPDKIEDKVYELIIPVEQLSPDMYSIRTVIEGKDYESDTLEFNISYPLFVT